MSIVTPRLQSERILLYPNMVNCSICIDILKRPVSLPCGHVFCNDCVYRAVTANGIKPCSTLHYCPTCRSPYTTVNMDSSLIPNHLRPHVLPHIRQLYLDETSSYTSTMSTPSAVAECARLSAENASLQFNCDLWRKRAEVHAAATLGLLNMARLARDHALQLREEKAQLERKYTLLKRKIGSDDIFSDSSSGPPSSRTSSASTTPDYSYPMPRHSMDGPRSRAVQLSDSRMSSMSSKSLNMSCSAWTDIQKNIKQEEAAQPLAKRRRTDAPISSPVVHSMVPLHDIDSDLLTPSISRRKSPSPSMASS